MTELLRPVVQGVVAPLEDRVNGLLGALANVPLLGTLPGSVNTDASGLLDDAASGQPISLSVLATDGTVIGPADDCVVTADGVTLDREAGIAIGGNRISGLGQNGATASAGEIGSIAMGNGASTAAGATDAIALGSGASAAAANSVALGAGSTTGADLSASAFRPGGAAVAGAVAQGEVSVGGVGNLRRLTNLAAGSAATDAVNVSQLAAVDQRVSDLAQWSIRYDTAERDLVTLAGTNGTRITNLRPGLVEAGSTDAVNGSQLAATNDALAELGDRAVTYDTDAAGERTNSISLNGDGTGPVRVRNVARAQSATDAVNLGQIQELLAMSDNQLAGMNARIDRVNQRLDGVEDQARQAAAIGLAAASLRFDDRPGKFSMGMSGGAWRGKAAVAAGLGYTDESGRVRMNATAALADGEVGGGAGVSFTFN